MAIYKSSHCYPFLNAVDIRVAINGESGAYPAQFLKCKVDTSNKTVTGYKIRILDSNNNQIFPPTDGIETISPVYELRLENMASLYEDNGTNSGVNGTFLQIPFFQNLNAKKLTSFNAVYYKPKYEVDYIILNSELSTALGASELSYSDNINNWQVTTIDNVNCLTYVWPSEETVRGWGGTKEKVLRDYSYGVDDSSNFTSNTNTYVYSSYEYDSSSNRIAVNGEYLKEGQIVLVASTSSDDSSKNGIYEVCKKATTESSSSTIQYLTYLKPYISLESDECVVIRKGEKYHNSVIEYEGDVCSKYEGNLWFCNKLTQVNQSEEIFYEVVQEAVEELNVSGEMFKWEITLYQGEVEYTVEDTPYGNLRYCSYNSLTDSYYDMVVSSGSVLGSNSTRIQLAYSDPFVGRIPNAAATIPNTKTETLVLQGKYMEISNSVDFTSLSGGSSRFYVQSYDATYGHVYPLSGALSSEAVELAKTVRFYKHSTNPEEILDGDIVQFGAGSNIELQFVSVNDSGVDKYDTEDDWKEALEEAGSVVTLLNTYLCISTDNEPMRNFIANISEGDTVLLAGQTIPKQNGVYIFHKMTISGDDLYYLKRSASYNTWAEFLGKVIFCYNYYDLNSVSSLVNEGSKNIQSLASAGTYTLWNYQDSVTGDSPLYFTEEMPLLIFEDKIERRHYYDYFYTGSSDPVTQPVTQIDGLTVAEGEIALCLITTTVEEASVTSVKVCKYSGNSWVLYEENEYGESTIPENGDFCYIQKGKAYGKRVVMYNKADTAITITWRLHTALVMKNTPTYTFISPFINASKGMKMKLKNNTVCIYDGTSINETQWITIKQVNPNLFCILHPTLYASTSASVASQNGTRSLSSDISAENNTPWKYEIRSYFKSSDINPFYCYESPYLIIYKNNVEYSDLAVLINDVQFMVLPEGSTSAEYEDYEEFIVDNETNEFIVNVSADSTVVVGHAIRMAARYQQFSGFSWSSYRWTLRDSEGKILQDTGERSDKTIGTEFYGLINDHIGDEEDDEDQVISYFVTLYLKDVLGNLFKYIIKIRIAPSAKTTLPQIDTEYVCDLHAIKITCPSEYNENFPGESEVRPFSIYRREFEVYNNPRKAIYGYYNVSDGNFYKDSSHTEIITPLSGCIYVDLTNSPNEYAYERILNGSGEYVYSITPRVRIHKGEWEPVVIKENLEEFYDFNIRNGHGYQYIICPYENTELNDSDIESQVYQVFANSDENSLVWIPSANEAYRENQGYITEGSSDTSYYTGAPINIKWDSWSISELIPEDYDKDIPLINRKYTVNPDQVWLFKYSLETGGQTQNISKGDITTLGKFPRLAYGNTNYISGEVNALIGSEIIPYSEHPYTERLRESRVEPLSTNEKVEMLQKWRDFVSSKNPKLLKDIKGQSWIVQIVGASNTPKNWIYQQPDTISFQWKQIADTKNAIIYLVSDTVGEYCEEESSTEWNPIFKDNLADEMREH